MQILNQSLDYYEIIYINEHLLVFVNHLSLKFYLFQVCFMTAWQVVLGSYQDEYMSCGRDARGFRLMPQIPCDLSRTTWCDDPGPQYPRFVHFYNCSSQNDCVINRNYKEAFEHK